jgi:cytochrome c-type biogenesis protein CcmH/NrfG
LAAGFACARAQELKKVNPWAAFEGAKGAAKLSPWNPRLHSSVGRLALAAGRAEEGIAAYREAAELDPYRASGWWRLAETKMAVHGVDVETVGHLRMAVELNPTDITYSNALGAAEKSVRQASPTLLESDPTKETELSK